MAAPTERNPVASKKIAKEVAAAVEIWRIPEYRESVLIPPHQLCVSGNNRGGQPLTLLVVHQTIAKSFQDDGFDPSRTPVGIVIWFTTSDAKSAAVSHNVRCFDGPQLYPPIETNEVKGATLS